MPPDEQGKAGEDATLKRIRALEDAFLELMPHGGIISLENAGRMLAQIETMRDLVVKNVERPELKPYYQQEPDFREGSVIMEQGRRHEQRRIEEKEEKEQTVSQLLKSIFETPPHEDPLHGKPALTGERLNEMLKELARSLISLKKSNSRAIQRILMNSELVRNFYRISPDFINKCFKTDESSTTDETISSCRSLCKTLKEELQVMDGGVSTGFRKLRTDFYDLLVLDPAKIWGEISIKHEKDPSVLSGYALEANEVCRDLFNGSYLFPKEVEAENDVKALQILAKTTPSDQKSFEIFQAACTKLELIHLIYYVKQIKLPYLQAVSERLKQRLDKNSRCRTLCR